jgi:DNA-directed RNA polymerase specialized sigma24 family protein
MDTNELLEMVFRGTTQMDREVLYLRYRCMYSFGDIADILGISEAMSRNHLRRGVREVMKNVLDAIPVQKVSLDEILHAGLEKARLKLPRDPLGFAA